MEVKIVYRDMAASQWQEKIEWCRANLYPGGYYEPNWHMQYPFIVFDDEKEYALFVLRWS